ncbi:MAG: type and secretion system protein [Candidatus Angelobacter sp.]|nr:type and secretion system protein [Candidatus Angelobacter sp.]
MPYSMQKWRISGGALALGVALALFCSGCVKSREAFRQQERADTSQSVDDSLRKSDDAQKKDPGNAQYKLDGYRVRFEAAQFHVTQGIRHLEKHESRLALREFETALSIDPSCMIARQELEYTKQLIAAEPTQGQSSPGAAPSDKQQAATIAAAPERGQQDSSLMEQPPALNPMSKEPVTLKMNEDSRIVFRTIGKLAGVNVIFDPEFPEKKISIDLVNVTIQQALRVACLEAKAFWKPVTSNIIMVFPDVSTRRRQEEEQILKKIYLQHIQTPQELTEITSGVQQMLELRHVQALPRDNAILIRDTPDKILLAARLIKDSDRGRAEVVVQISVLQVRRDRARSLGIQPGSRTTLAFAPAAALGPAGAVGLDKLAQISQGDFALTIPNAVASALMTDSSTKIIQNPQIRVTDGESARLRVGDRVPVATGSFQATAGLGPVVNTQFQYIDVGVNIDIAPHVHPDHSVSMKLGVEVSSVNGNVNIGGVEQPVISQRRIEHEIRLQEGEVSILGGLAERSQSKSVSGWPGLSRLPLLRYLFSGEDVNNSENEVLVVVTPKLVRVRELAQESLQALSVGTDTEMMLRQQDDVVAPQVVSLKQNADWSETRGINSTTASPSDNPSTVRVEPATIAVKPGETTVLQVHLENVEDLFSASVLMKYDPQLLSIEDVQHGDFLSGGTQEVAIVQRIDKEKGEARIFTTRQPNTAGVNGKGVLLSLVVRRLTSSPASMQLMEVGVRNSRQKSLPVRIAEATTEIQ